GQHDARGVDGARAGDVRDRRPQGSDHVFQGKAQAAIREGLILPMDAAEPQGEDVRTMLRDSLRGFLGTQWKMEAAATPSQLADQTSSIWTRLVGQGVAALGHDRSEGGLREILVAMAELGRASCPAPMWSAGLT